MGLLLAAQYNHELTGRDIYIVGRHQPFTFRGERRGDSLWIGWPAILETDGDTVPAIPFSRS